MSGKLKIAGLLAAIAVIAWGIWFLQVERDYRGTSKGQQETLRLPHEAVPENVKFLRELALKSDEEFLSLTDRIDFMAYQRVVYDAYIEGLGVTSSRERRERLEMIANGTDADAAAMAKLVQLRIASGEDRKSRAIDVIKSLDTMSADGRIQVMNLLLNQMGEEQSWLGDLRNYIYKSKHADVVALGLRHLAAMRDSWVGENIGYFVKHKDAPVRAAAVQSLRYYCSSSAEKLLRDLTTLETDPSVLIRVVDEVMQFPKLDASAALVSLSGRFPGEKELQRKIKENSELIKSGTFRAACPNY